MGDNGPQYFAEYSLWNDSAYSIFSINRFNRIEFMRPVAGSIFLTPGDLEEKDKESSDVVHQVVLPPPQPRVRSSPGFERYIRRAFKVVTREDLTRDPAAFRKDPESDDSDTSLDRLRNRDLYSRPPRPRWRTAQQVNGRGRKKMNLMQQRLEQALAQPAKIERGANMMHRMGWSGGALGRGGGGIVEPIAPNPYYVRMLNAAYAHTTAGFGLAQDSDSAESSESDTTSSKHRQQQQKKSKKKKDPSHPQHKKSRKIKEQEFITNVLQYIREFVKNDLQVEMFFEPRLNPRDRRIIHQIVGKLMHDETEDNELSFDTIEMVHLVDDIARRNQYSLGTVSKGEPPQRQICIYKEATESMYLVSPEDIRPGDDDESNPFLQSIARHLKPDAERSEYTVLDRMIDYFVEFSTEDAYTEFRFLGAFTIEEIDVMSAFFGMITCIIDKSPYLDLPARLVAVFEKGVNYSAAEDANGYISIKKSYKDKKESAEEKVAEK